MLSAGEHIVSEQLLFSRKGKDSSFFRSSPLLFLISLLHSLLKVTYSTQYSSPITRFKSIILHSKIVVEVMDVQTLVDKLAKEVRDAREKQGISQRELAQRLNMNTHTIMDFEIGRSNPRIETILLIAAELHISLDAVLYTGSNKPNSVDAEVLEFFAGKSRQETHHYIDICRRIEELRSTEQGE